MRSNNWHCWYENTERNPFRNTATTDAIIGPVFLVAVRVWQADIILYVHGIVGNKTIVNNCESGVNSNKTWFNILNTVIL